MDKSKEQIQWEDYCREELKALAPVFASLNITLEKSQPHLQGERYLMSGKKLVLVGAHEGVKAIIKASRDPHGIREIEHEHLCSETLKKIKFGYQAFLMPEERLYSKRGDHILLVTAYIEQRSSFLALPLREQFALALKAFKTEESVHASTYAHTVTIRNVFGFWNAHTYFRWYRKFAKQARAAQQNEALSRVLSAAYEVLVHEEENIERYCGFLTHEDFAPHNMRITGNDIFLIDLSSLRFGNKYESWGRFLNFMLLYNRPLEQALTQYVVLNRSKEEQAALRLMGIYKTVELLAYHSKAAQQSSGSLQKLSQKRVEFWSRVLESFINKQPISNEAIEEYKRTRDSLRSEEEIERQKELQQL